MMPLAWLTVAFLLALIAGTSLRLWLASRQIGAARAHRDRVPGAFAAQVSLPEHQKAADYTIARVRLGRVEALVDALVILVLTLGGGIAGLDALWRHTGWSEPWHGLAVMLSVFAITALIGLPFALWRTFRVEAAFGFNRSTLGLFFADRLKGLLVALLIGVPLVLGALVLMRRGGTLWWLYAWAAWLAVSVALSWAWPAFIAPLFNRFTPLTDATLKARIDALLARCGFASKGVFIVDGSRRSAHGNAYFTGLGRNKRVVFFDTLLERLGAAEVEAVLAHELGHFRLRHIRKRLLISAALSLIGLAVLAWLARQPGFYPALGLRGASAYGALLLFLLVAPVFTFFLTPLSAWWSRRHEFEADRFAAEHANAAQLADALVKLYRDNATTLTPDHITSAFYDSHPPAIVRIATLQELAARP
ncbi:MAG TPA: M48 family metallopeptidase [Steroidobacteraceae bacterium]|nr:M48 family metallopeptidase [Steroidobacteraceae bacterium]